MAETTNTSKQSRALAAIRHEFEAGRPVIYLQSSEEDRVVGLLRQAASDLAGGKTELYLWSVTDGLQIGTGRHKSQPDGARGILDFIHGYDRPAIFLLKDFHEFLRDAVDIRRRIRDLYYSCLGTGKFAVILSPVRYIPEEISRELVFLPVPIPDVIELESLLRDEAKGLQKALPEEAVYPLMRAMQGLTYNEARHAIRRAATEHGSLDAGAVSSIQEEKQLLVRKSGLVEYAPETTGLDQLGGLDSLKKWLVQRRELFYSRESISAEIVPKGLLLMGVSGCGKSLAARVIANVFGLPLYRIDMVRVFAAGLGLAERNFADACHAMEEVSPAVVWFDEIENGISRQHQDNTGSLDRIFGFFLTWMQEKPTGLFVAATANRIDLLPAEMIRKGRFDQVFFLDLPNQEERHQIFEIHLKKRQIEPSLLSLDLVASRTEGWTGAEIEQCVISALVAARLANETLTDKYLLPSLNQIVPLSKTMKEQVQHIRSWAFDRAVNATSRKKV